MKVHIRFMGETDQYDLSDFTVGDRIIIRVRPSPRHREGITLPEIEFAGVVESKDELADEITVKNRVKND